MHRGYTVYAGILRCSQRWLNRAATTKQAAVAISTAGVPMYLGPALVGPGWTWSDDVCPGSTTSVRTVRRLSASAESSVCGRGTRTCRVASVAPSLVTTSIGYPVGIDAHAVDESNSNGEPYCTRKPRQPHLSVRPDTTKHVSRIRFAESESGLGLDSAKPSVHRIRIRESSESSFELWRGFTCDTGSKWRRNNRTNLNKQPWRHTGSRPRIQVIRFASESEPGFAVNLNIDSVKSNTVIVTDHGICDICSNWPHLAMRSDNNTYSHDI